LDEKNRYLVLDEKNWYQTGKAAESLKSETLRYLNSGGV
jgi:hypothetical protein